MTTTAVGVIFLLAADRILKYWALNWLYNAKIDIIPRLAAFELFKNEAIAFSIPIPPVVAVPLIVLVMVFLGVWLTGGALRSWDWAETGLSLVLAGAASNLYDRLQYGFVIDYINILWWPVFNIADVMITLGVALVGWRLIRGGRSRV